jgi:hypothetical protein
VKIHFRTKDQPRVTEYTNYDGDNIPVTGHTELLIRWGGNSQDDGQLRIVATIQQWRELNLVVEQAIADLPDTRAALRKDKADRDKLAQTIAATRDRLENIGK